MPRAVVISSSRPKSGRASNRYSSLNAGTFDTATKAPKWTSRKFADPFPSLACEQFHTSLNHSRNVVLEGLSGRLPVMASQRSRGDWADRDRTQLSWQFHTCRGEKCKQITHRR